MKKYIIILAIVVIILGATLLTFLNKPIESENKTVSGQCSLDSDCVIAGCSSQLCVPKSLADIVTTCDYRPEYSCLRATTCGCDTIANKCRWNETNIYISCIRQVSNQ